MRNQNSHNTARKKKTSENALATKTYSSIYTGNPRGEIWTDTVNSIC